MKNIIFLLALFTITTFPQDEREQEVVDDYFRLLDNYRTPASFENNLKSNNEQLLHFASKMYHIYQNYPEKAKPIIWRDTYKERDEYVEIAYGTIQHAVAVELKKYYPIEIYNILKAPYILRIKVLSKYRSEYYYCDEKYERLVLSALIEHNLSGSRYSTGDTIEISAGIYNEDRMSLYEVGERYIVPLNFSYLCNFEMDDLLVLARPLRVEVDKVLDESQYFLGKPELDWEEMKANYENAVEVLMSGGIK